MLSGVKAESSQVYLKKEIPLTSHHSYILTPGCFLCVFISASGEARPPLKALIFSVSLLNHSCYYNGKLFVSTGQRSQSRAAIIHVHRATNEVASLGARATPLCNRCLACQQMKCEATPTRITLLFQHWLGEEQDIPRAISEVCVSSSNSYK